ncbi:MAG TPA: SDR family oxidoreductase [Pirellulaceae bacterium]|nr:SDR family oxidoreductase [Pirellulaceae bacterium]
MTIKPVALVTGGTSGIGLATARLLAENGYDIAICGRNTPRLHQARAAIQKSRAGTRALAIPADFSEPLSSPQMCDQTFTEFGRLDVVVNAAAVAALSSFDAITTEQFDEMLNVNIRSLFHVTQAAWRIMQQQGNGTIINVSSLAAVDPFDGLGIYGASKAWLDLLTRSLAREGKRWGIRVHSVQPGAVETPMLRGLFPDFPAEQTVSPEDVAEVIFGLLDPCWRNSNGQIVQVSRQ